MIRSRVSWEHGSLQRDFSCALTRHSHESIHVWLASARLKCLLVPHRLEEADHLKCACAGCGHVIEYLPAAAGQVVECPKCGEKSLLPPADAKPSRAPAAS